MLTFKNLFFAELFQLLHSLIISYAYSNLLEIIWYAYITTLWFGLYHQGLWVNFAKDQLFCLLGPNGAGKTTAINCLTGITPVTSGDGKYLSNVQFPQLQLIFTLVMYDILWTALIYGNSIRNSVGMSNIQKMIGVCPQVTLWFYLFSFIEAYCQLAQ